jgi:predicted alpha/beta-fold hydrolase
LWGKFLRQAPVQPTVIERLGTPDGDTVVLHHLESAAKAGAPVLLLLHGLEGSSRSHYVQGLLGQAAIRGWHAAAMVFRSCGGEMNRARRLYHSGETTDLALVVGHVAELYPESRILIAGASLGGNVLLKYLGEQGHSVSPRIAGAAAVSVPFDLARSSRFIDRGFSKVYQRHFLKSLRRKARAKLEQYPGIVLQERISGMRTMFDFDDAFTAPVHGFADANDYYARSSSKGWLNGIRVDTLLLSAVDDPFLPAQVLDDVREISRTNPHLTVEFTSHGGHVGFVTGASPFGPAYYLEQRVGDFLAART